MLDLKVLVVQMGARRDYELARMLEERGLLTALQTGAAWTDERGAGWVFDALGPKIKTARFRRTVRGVPPYKVRTTPWPEIVGFALRGVGLEPEQRFRIEDWFLGWSARRRGLAGANVVLNTTGNGGLGYLKWAKSQGAKIATDVVITPFALEIVKAEAERWPGWLEIEDVRKAIFTNRRHMEQIVSVSDMLVCPSDSVVEGLSAIRGIDENKIVKIPYGLGSTQIVPGAPIEKRVLFAGEASLRKGLPYLAEAASRLRACDPGFEFRVAGKVSDVVRSRPECASLIFLGHLGPQQMAQEFKVADVFCLPSLAEGMASVTLEAMAYGLPCVVTRSSGAPVQDEVEGRLVLERSGAAIADAISDICCNRKLRSRMSEAALVRVRQHTLEVVGERLQSALMGLLTPDATLCV